MSLPTWLAAGWLQSHKTSRAEIREPRCIPSDRLFDGSALHFHARFRDLRHPATYPRPAGAYSTQSAG